MFLHFPETSADSSKLGFSLVRVTSLMVSSGRLWVGTGNGVVLTVPFNTAADEVRPRAPLESQAPVKVYEEGSAGEEAGAAAGAEPRPEPERAIAPATFLPLVNADEVHMSFHGHRDVVKFFVAVPGEGIRDRRMPGDRRVLPASLGGVLSDPANKISRERKREHKVIVCCKESTYSPSSCQETWPILASFSHFSGTVEISKNLEGKKKLKKLSASQNISYSCSCF